ncbi:MAG: cytidylate kinase family protein [Termitinemataceae bacterium]|nr:MAG: cytidylate kinase family protein [Termitinemataceae bacterium]
MAIITISRELAALGDEIAAELLKRHNYHFVDKKLIDKRLNSYGISSQKIEKYDEKKPSFFASLSRDRDEYLHYLKQAILAEAESGDCIFIERGASAIFTNTPGLIPIFLTSSMDVRTERVKSYFHCDEKAALKIITASDQNRSGFYKYFFDVDCKDPRNYLLTLNTSHITPQTCATVIEEIIKGTVTSEANEHLKKRIKEMNLAISVIHHVLYEKRIAINFLEASVQNNDVTLFGVASSATIADAGVSAAKEVPSIQSVQSEIQVVHEYSVMP